MSKTEAIVNEEVPSAKENQHVLRPRKPWDRWMRIKFIVATVVTVVIVGGLLYYFYGYRDRRISVDLNYAKDYTQDAATTGAVKSALALNNQLSSLRIHVNSSNSPGMKGNDVTLSGQVPTEDDKRVAEAVARSTRGVGNVVNNLVVDPKTQSTSSERHYVSDLEIKASFLQSIMNNPSLKTQLIYIDVNNGYVRLTGIVKSSTQKADAESAARSIVNVRDVDAKALVVSDSDDGKA